VEKRVKQSLVTSMTLYRLPSSEVQKKTKIRKSGLIVLVSLIIFLGLAFNINYVYAHTYQGVNVMVAYDEELANTANWVYWLSPSEFCRRIVSCVSSRFEDAFNIKFTIKCYVSWDSDDSITDDICAFEGEIISETEFYTGMEYYGLTIDILIAFSDQTVTYEGDIVYGKANSILGTAIVFEEYDYWGWEQYTDNILQHELSHLYNCSNEYIPDHDCIMNGWPVYLGFPDRWVPYAFTTVNWCDTCRNQINENKYKWGRREIVGGGLGPPWSEPYSGGMH